MYKILQKKELTATIKLFEIEAPLVARKAQVGQFVMLRIDEKGERIPLTIFDSDPGRGTVSIIFQEVGKTTKELGTLNAQDALLDFVGPLGVPSHIQNYGTAICIGGGVGTAEVYPQVKALKEAGNKVIAIVGARTKELVILEDELSKICDQVLITTDDGSYGKKGFVTDALKELTRKGQRIDRIIAIGPLVMMKAVVELVRPKQIPTIVSLNTIMVDGTGMCASCRATVGGEMRLACVDGPDFDGYLVDFDELLCRQDRFLDQEKLSLEKYEKTS